VVASLTFWANICMYRHAFDYWGPSAEEFALLHAWSLAVEEQFYVFYPLLLLWVTRFGQRTLRWVLVAMSAGGLILCIYGAQRHPVATFFLLPTRAWELFIGCILALAMAKGDLLKGSMPGWLRGIAADMGFGLIIASTLLVRNGAYFPAPLGLLPTMGAALFIGFGRNAGWARHVLSLGPVVYLGKLSYSWYLFHWPVIVMFRKLGIDEVLPALGAGLGLAVVCHHWIEQPVRRIREDWVLTRVVVPVMLIGASSYLLSRLDLQRRIEVSPPVTWCGLDLMPWRAKWKPNPHCITPELALNSDSSVRRVVPIPGPLRVLILGDSHLKSVLPALDQVLGEAGLNYAAFPASGASPFFVPEGADYRDYAETSIWEKEERLVLDQTRLRFLSTNQPTLIILTARWGLWQRSGRDGIQAGLQRIQELAPRAQLLIVGQPPELPFGSSGFFETPPRLGLLTPSREPKHVRVRRHMAHVWLTEYASLHSGVHFVDTEAVFLKAGIVEFIEKGKLLYFDDDHLSVDGSFRLVPVLNEALRKIPSILPLAAP
jgi:hypothetical protein